MKCAAGGLEFKMLHVETKYTKTTIKERRHVSLLQDFLRSIVFLASRYTVSLTDGPLVATICYFASFPCCCTQVLQLVVPALQRRDIVC